MLLHTCHAMTLVENHVKLQIVMTVTHRDQKMLKRVCISRRRREVSSITQQKTSREREMTLAVMLPMQTRSIC